MDALDEHFDGVDLDRDVWVPHYLAHWSSRAESAATWQLTGEGLRLSIPPEQPLWCADTHPEPMRVSCIQSGAWSGPVGSTIGPQPFAAGLIVREEQATHWGWTPRYGRVEVRMRALVSASSMFAFWLSGIEDRPDRSGEICVAEIFGRSIGDGGADVGAGIHRFRDPDLTEDFTTVRQEIDTTAFHTYAVDWTPREVRISVDGHELRRLDQSPAYPMQIMIGVFEFPGRRTDADGLFEPEVVVSHVRGWPLETSA